MTIGLDMIDLKDAERVVKSDKFTQFLLTNTTQFGAAAFILQTLIDKIDEAKEILSSEDKDD